MIFRNKIKKMENSLIPNKKSFISGKSDFHDIININQEQKALDITNNYSTKKFSTIIQQKKNILKNLNTLLSTKSNKEIFNPSKSSKKNGLKKEKTITNSLTNSNILMRSTEENLITNINNKEEKLLSKISNIESKKDLLENTFIKNVVKLFNKVIMKEREQNEQTKSKNRSSSKIIGCELIKDIEKEKNKFYNKAKSITKQKRKSAMLSPEFNPFFKFGENIKKKISKISNTRSFEKKNIDSEKNKKGKVSIFSKRNDLQIKTYKDINSDISKMIRKSSIRDMKNELKKFESLEIDKMIGKCPKRRETYDLKRKTLNQTNLEFDINRLQAALKEEEYQKKFRNIFLCDNLYDSLDEDELEDLVKSNTFFIGPNDLSCYIIDSLTLISSIISITYLPYFLAFILGNCKFHFFSKTYLFFLFIELTYIIDLLTGFFRAYYNFEEVLIVKKRYMSLNYLNTSFFLDLIEAIPFFLILNFYQEDCNNLIHYNFAFTNNLKYSLLLLKLLKVTKTFNNSAVKLIDKLLNKSNFFSDWKAVLANILIIFCAIHVATSYFIYLGKNIHPGWSSGALLQSESNTELYIAAFYYVITTLTTVGYGDITVISNYERYFQILLLIVGTFSYSFLLTYISNYIKKNHDKYIVYEEKVKILEEIKINYPNLSNDLYERITRYLNYNKSRYKYNIKYVLDSLPSSIQNNLIIEIYKPIIKNFTFFKYFENSDFFVKIVTSMKPILSMKDNILVQEGDVIEDIIFIKKGVLSLQIGIDLDDPKKYAEEHLGKINKKNSVIKPETLSKFNNTTIITPKNNFEPSLTFYSLDSKKNKKMEKKTYIKKNIKIIDLRKNEHFGDILMILNEKSPVTIKVRSKKAELLFLQKTEATEISNLYPNIWKKIVNKSLHNMNEIKKIIRKKIIAYCEMNNIKINEDLKKDNFKKKVKFKTDNTEIGKHKDKEYIKTIIKEEDESKFISTKNSVISIKSRKKSDASYNKCILDKINNPNELESKKSEKNSFSSSSSSSSDKSKSENNENNNKNLSDKKDKNSNQSKKSIISNNSEKILKKNKIINDIIVSLNQSNINSILDEKNKNTTKIKNINLNTSINNEYQSDIVINQVNKRNSDIQLNDINKNYKDDNLERINEEIFFNEDLGTNIINRHISMNNFDKNNFIFHSREKITQKNEELISQKNTCDKLDKLLREDNENNLFDNNSDNTEKINKKINIYNNIVINNSHKNANIINETYNKINKFTILENSMVDSFKIESIYENINKLSQYKYSIEPELQKKVKNILNDRPLASYKTIQSSKNNTRIIFKEMSTPNKKREVSPFSEKKIKYGTANNSPSRNHKLKKTKTFFRDKNVNNSSIKKKVNIRLSTNNINDEEDTFYTRIKVAKSFRKPTSKPTSKLRDIKKTNNYERQITKNIEKNKQNLNNPEEYFTGFFNNILSKKDLENLK